MAFFTNISKFSPHIITLVSGLPPKPLGLQTLQLNKIRDPGSEMMGLRAPKDLLWDPDCWLFLSGQWISSYCIFYDIKVVCFKTNRVQCMCIFGFWKGNFEKKSGTSHWEMSVSCTTQEYDNVTTPYYRICRCLQEVVAKKRFQV